MQNRENQTETAKCLIYNVHFESEGIILAYWNCLLFDGIPVYLNIFRLFAIHSIIRKSLKENSKMIIVGI